MRCPPTPFVLVIEENNKKEQKKEKNKRGKKTKEVEFRKKEMIRLVHRAVGISPFGLQAVSNLDERIRVCFVQVLYDVFDVSETKNKIMTSCSINKLFQR